ncbi:hypothetical protein Pcinc_036643 [Petrolisthes cinctipes]|uniref:G-protein coupled receptors family 1 profile domain-containing protein n=1 Tax=Petrolisthes cinctipes TaxID=88211 RepID=A0AAE1EM58_PETCI|nr:hypothetical protein Pcinc_036643 [Petrolisthes cinctipes]
MTRTTTHLLLLHLGVINVFLALIFLFLIFPATVQVGWWGGAGSGCVTGAAWSGLHVAGAWTITALNVDKFVAIAAPLHYARFVSPRRVGLALVGAWVVAGGLCALPLAHPGLRGVPNPPAPCLPNVADAKGGLGRTYAGAAAGLGYILPAALVAGANLRILVIARQHRHRIVSALWDVTLSAQATITPQRPHLYLARYRGRSAAAAVLHPLATFLLLYLPAAVTLLYEAGSRAPAPQALTLVTLSLLSLAPAVNGFVYGVRSKVLRHNLKSFLRKRLYRSEVHHEIQSRPSTAPTSRRPSLNPSLSLPLPARLTRRMSEILIQPQSVATPSSDGGSCRAVGRRGSEASSMRGKGSCLSLPRPATASPQPLGSQTFLPDMGGSSPGGGSAKEFPTSSPPCSPMGRGLRGSLRMLGQCGSQDEGSGGSGDSGGGSIGGGGSVGGGGAGSGSQGGSHRSSLRRALFARNKQKSLDLEMTTLSAPSNTDPAPPRSASQQIVGELGSPSLVRPLLLPRCPPQQGPPLSPARRTKRVSWSSDSFSDTPMDSDPEGLYNNNSSTSATSTAIGCPPRYRKKAVLRHNGLRYGLSRVSLERIDSEDTRAPTPPSPSTRYTTSNTNQPTTPPSPRPQPSSPLFSRFQSSSPSSPLITTPPSPLVHPLTRPSPVSTPPSSNPSKQSFPSTPPSSNTSKHSLPSTPSSTTTPRYPLPNLSSPSTRPPLPSTPSSCTTPSRQPLPSTPPYINPSPSRQFFPSTPPLSITPPRQSLPSTPTSSTPPLKHPQISTPPSSNTPSRQPFPPTPPSRQPQTSTPPSSTTPSRQPLPPTPPFRYPQTSTPPTSTTPCRQPLSSTPPYTTPSRQVFFPSTPPSSTTHSKQPSLPSTPSPTSLHNTPKRGPPPPIPTRPSNGYPFTYSSPSHIHTTPPHNHTTPPHNNHKSPPYNHTLPYNHNTSPHNHTSPPHNNHNTSPHNHTLPHNLNTSPHNNHHTSPPHNNHHTTPPSTPNSTTCPPHSILANGKLHSVHNGRHPLADVYPHA